MNPIDQARLWLSGRLFEKRGGYWLDNRPVSLTHIMVETNRLRFHANETQITGNPAWEYRP